MTEKQVEILNALRDWERPFAAKPIIGPGGWVLRIDAERAFHGPEYREAFEGLYAAGCFDSFFDGRSYQMNDRGRAAIADFDERRT